MICRYSVTIVIVTLFSLYSSAAVVDSDEPKKDVSYEKYRLPKSIRPDYYKLNVLTHINDDEGFKFIGDVAIKIFVSESTRNITLHAKNLNINTNEIIVKSISNNSKSDAQIPIERSEFITENDFFVIHTNDELVKGGIYEVSIPFNGTLSSGLLGYYRSSYNDKRSKQKRWLAVTQFEATYARLAFPCFDEPEMKARFEISLEHHKNFTALSNMPLKVSENIPDKPDWVCDKFDVTVPMSTYLVAYSINDFEYRESKMNQGTLFRIWARRDAIDQVDYAKDIGPKVLKYFEKTFNVEYPLPKMDMIAIPDFSAGAMENWGLVTYRETALLYQPNISSSASQFRVANVIAHELAHQWFGNLVTMRWWTDLWLNEGFATYVASLGVHHLHPEWNSFQEESLTTTVNVFSFDSLRSSHPVSVTIGNPNQISSIFDRIAYDKGSSIIRMMYLFLGDEVFFNGISRYLKKYKYSNAEQDNLWESLTEEAHKHEVLSENMSIKHIMDSWTLQTGYPVITVARNYNNNSAIVTQTRFFNDPDKVARSSDENSCWFVPLSYTSNQQLDFNTTEPRDWLECDEQNHQIVKELVDLPEDDEWVLFNIQISGLYKVRYDQKNWELLIEQLTGPEYDRISPLNRAELINDALDLAWSGDQDYGIALRLLKYLKQEKDYLPWKAALGTLSDVNRMLKRTSQYGQFKDYIKRVITPIYERFGGLNTDRKKGDKYDVIKHKILICGWACRFEVGDCQAKSIEYFGKWMNSSDPDTKNPVPLDLRSTIYCTAVRSGGENEWRFLWERYTHSNVGAERALILGALGCSREIWLLQRYLDWTLDESSGVRNQDRSIIFSGVARSDVGFLLAKAFFFDRIDNIYKNVLPEPVRIERYISVLASQMFSDNEYNEFESFIQNRSSIFDQVERGVQQSLETINIQRRWQVKNYNEIGRLLTEN